MRPTRPQRFDTAHESSTALAGRLFQGPERWGWEYVEPAPIRPMPHPTPVWQEPTPPDLSELQQRHARLQAILSNITSMVSYYRRLMVLVALLVLLLVFQSPLVGIGLLVAAAAAMVVLNYLVQVPLREMERIKQQAAVAREAARQRFAAAESEWQAEAARFEAGERKRIDATPLLFPFAPAGQASRVDVFGGTPAGWASLLATLGGSVLGGGSSMTVLDLSGNNVAAALAELADTVRVPVSVGSAPSDLERAGLLGELDPEDLAEILAEAMDAMRGRSDQRDLPAMDAELIRTVARRLDQPLTFRRLAAGIRVVRSTADPDDDGLLSIPEVERLTEQVDLIDKSERVRDELRFIGNQLDLLAKEQSSDRSGGSHAAVRLWTPGGLSVIRTDGRNARGKEFVDHVLFRTVAHHVAQGRPGVDDPVLVVVGADELGRAALEAMVRNAWRARVRLVFMFARLREDAADLLGGGDGVALLMRIGNPQEADTAATHVGRGYTFQLSQVARQLGRTVTRGENNSVTDQVGGSETFTEGGSDTSTSGPSSSRSLGDTWSRSLTDSWSRSTTTGTSSSEADSRTDGQTYQRSYEFVVEPYQIQHLEQTAFVLVHSGPEGRRVTMGDCFPGLAVTDRVSIASR